MADMETMDAFGLGEKVMAMADRVRTMNAINPGATGEYRMKIDGDTFVIAVRLEQIAENANCSGDIDRSGLAQEVDDISYAGVGP